MWNGSFFCFGNLARDRILKFLRIFLRFVGLRSYYTLISESMADLEYLQVRFLWLGLSLGCFSWFEDRCSMAHGFCFGYHFFDMVNSSVKLIEAINI